MKRSLMKMRMEMQEKLRHSRASEASLSRTCPSPGETTRPSLQLKASSSEQVQHSFERIDETLAQHVFTGQIFTDVMTAQLSLMESDRDKGRNLLLDVPGRSLTLMNPERGAPLPACPPLVAVIDTSALLPPQGYVDRVVQSRDHPVTRLTQTYMRVIGDFQKDFSWTITS
ncbi:hypothetical protein FQA47_005200 [Oryzias melastigma]|uniref:Uncharacterized protein n=1 Tax=Oryzias melastigma TaxID=30732 RepID=A0A834C5Y0_ORYME|nr:hypothetical protein FQA47_005200 [Oryzias melastigma]